MNNDLWQNFLKSGSVADYLIYKQSEYIDGDGTNNHADSDKGFDNKRTDYSGE